MKHFQGLVKSHATTLNKFKLILFFNYIRENFDARQLITWPTYGVEADIMMIYDDSWLNTLHNGNDAAARAQIDAIMAHVQTFYNLPSLGTTIKINIKEVTHAAGKGPWTATGANLGYYYVKYRVVVSSWQKTTFSSGYPVSSYNIKN